MKMRAPIRVQVRYFAVLRQQRGLDAETRGTSAATARELYAELRAATPLTYPAEKLRVAINDEFAEWDRALNDGDRVAFVPPVSGG